MEMKIYHCMNQEENPIPYWMRGTEKKKEEKTKDLVQQFKQNPDAFFPPIIPPAKPKLK